MYSFNSKDGERWGPITNDDNIEKKTRVGLTQMIEEIFGLEYSQTQKKKNLNGCARAYSKVNERKKMCMIRNRDKAILWIFLVVII